MPRNLPPARARAVGLVLVCVAGGLWGTGGIAVQLIRQHQALSPWTISAYRTSIAACLLLVAVLATGRARATLGTVLGSGLGSGLGSPLPVVAVGATTATYQALYFVAVSLVGVTIATVVSLGSAPVFVLALQAATSRRWPSRRSLADVAAALMGLVLVVVTPSAGDRIGAAGATVGGVVAALCSGLGFACATILSERLARRHEPLVLTAASTVVGSALLVPLAFATGGPVIAHAPRTWLLLAYLGAATFALAYGLLFAGLRHTTSAAAALAALLEPVVATLLALTILGERLSVVGAVGLGLILAAILGQGLTNRSPGGGGR